MGQADRGLGSRDGLFVFIDPEEAARPAEAHFVRAQAFDKRLELAIVSERESDLYTVCNWIETIHMRILKEGSK